MISSQMSENKDKLAQYERNERYLGEELFKRLKTVKEYQFTSGRICYDSLVTNTENKHILVEIKVRRFRRERYNTYILQVDKLQNLIKRAEKMKLEEIRYINFFESDETNKVEFIIFNLSERIKQWQKKPPKVEKMKMNIETWKSEDVKALKDIILLEFDDKIDSKGDFYLN